ncbi:helix-turn-helix domain-containing protein [Rouxiella badensis]|uniref:helix-turn-helix domain-containing protein n=1 Tax=Rouxiella badensis TaxID=1646377 RepID=UPI003C60185A
MTIVISNSNEHLTLYTPSYKFTDMKTTLSERLKIAMDLHGKRMSQGTLAKLSGISQPTVNRLLTGKVSGSGHLIQIANALDVDAEWLATGKGEMLKGKMTPIAEKLESLKAVPLWNAEGKTEEAVICPIGKPTSSWRAYVLEKNSGCREATAGSLIFVDTEASPGTKDYVVARVGKDVSVYSYLSGGAKGYLAVDDERIPLVDLSSTGELIGVVQFILRDMRR